MVKLLHHDEDRIIIRLIDGTIVTVNDAYFMMKAIPGRRRTEKKIFEYGDMLAINDALKKIFPMIIRPS